MAFDGSLLDRPTGPDEQPISDALCSPTTACTRRRPRRPCSRRTATASTTTQTLHVQARPPVAGDGDPDRARRSTRTLVQDAEQPGVYTLQWDGRDAGARGQLALLGDGASTILAARRRPSGRSRSTRRSARWRRPAARSCVRSARRVDRAFTLAHAGRGHGDRRERQRHRHRDAPRRRSSSPGRAACAGTDATRTGSLAGRAYRVRVVATNSIGKATLTAPVRCAALVDSPAVLASISSSFTSQVASHGAYAVFVLMAIDAVFPAASELVMLYAGAVAAGVFGSAHHVSLFGAKIGFGVGRLHRRWRSRARSATSSARSSAGGSATTAAGRCSSATAAGSTSRPSKLERAERWFDRWGNVGVLARPDHARHPLVRLDPGRRLPDAARAVHRADRCSARRSGPSRSPAPATGSARATSGSTTTSVTPSTRSLQASCCSRRISSIDGGKAGTVRRRDDPAR